MLDLWSKILRALSRRLTERTEPAPTSTDRVLPNDTFGSLPVLGIWTTEVHFTIPSGLSAIDSVIALLDEIYRNYQDDIKMSQHLLQDFPPSDIEEFHAFRRREVWRIGSFVVFALNLEQILRQQYGNLRSFVERLHPNTNISFDEMIERRKGEIEGCKYYRDKIFAHTAFGAPRREDNRSMKATSLAYLAAQMTSVSPDGIALGGASVVVGEEEPPTFQRLDFPKMVSDFRHHLREWRRMYHDLCVILQDSADDDIRECIGDAVEIRRSERSS
jgi:hypothetical protein